MAEHSTIEWTDATWNVITGCSIESPGCTNCYAMKLAGTRLRNHPSRAGLTKPSAAGPVWTGEVRFNDEWLHQPTSWRRPRDIFVCAHGDLFHPAVPTEWIDLVFNEMQAADQHRFQVLTKRPQRAATYLRSSRGAQPLPHVLIGASVENQRYADERRESMRDIASAGWCSWVSYEPALGPVAWGGWEFLCWMVSGGESGNDTHPSHPDWHRAARNYCSKHEIPYHFKQWGEWSAHQIGKRGDIEPPMPMGLKRLKEWRTDLQRFADVPNDAMTAEVFRPGATLALPVGKKAAGRLLDGVEHNGFPEVR